MKLSLAFAFLMLLQVSANGSFFEKKMVFSLHDVTLKTVLDKINLQSGYKFFYDVNAVKDQQILSISAKKENIGQVLSKMSRLVPIAYTINGKQVVLTNKSLAPPIKVEQQQEVTGKVTDKDGTPLPGANVLVKGTSIGAQTDFDGIFRIEVPSGNSILEISFVGFETEEVDVTGKNEVTVVMDADSAQLDDVIVVGSRGKPRTSFDSPVPVDNIQISELEMTGKGVLDQQLMFKVPSYNATQQPISDAAAHFSPAGLRGLLPSRTLVLVNGKRKNLSALVYSYVTPGRGEVGVDMKSVPSAALERVEVLRDGAAAQYGSDAVAGVINLVLKKKSDPFINTSYGITTEGDGEQYQLEAGFGMDIFEKGYANFTFNYFDQKRSQRAGTITSAADEEAYWGVDQDLTSFLQRNPSAGFQVGIPDMKITNFAYNMGYTIDAETETEIYSFGTLMSRSGAAPQFARVPYWVSGFEQIYPGADFFLAEMAPQIADHTFALGIKTVFNGWNFDLSSTLGKNRIDYYINNSFNQSFGAASPSDFYNGAHQFSNVVNNLDIVRTFENAGVNALTVAFGAEHRTERFVTEEGEFASYGDATPDDLTDRTGSESFGGFKPENASDDYRSNFGVYTDITADFTEDFLIGGALRFEDYSDFGPI